MQQGYIKLHRQLLDTDIFENPKLLKVFIWCLLKATHKEREQRVGRKIVKLKQGQFIFGRAKASLELDIPQSTIWDYMKLLENRRTISIKSNNKYSVVTIENWGLYQNNDDFPTAKPTAKPTTNGQQMDTNKNVKNVKNNNIVAKKFADTSDEYRLSMFLLNHIRENNPNSKEPNIQSWCKQFDYMIRLDKRDIEEIKEVIKWCQSNSFWSSNILSPKKLREKYDTLYMQMKNSKDKKEQSEQQTFKSLYGANKL
ncbi:MAG: hypothetical protein SO148_01085 [Candidatus Onthovivens sp.]|nr:hypothetical protein [Candidatus Onthovivens sp.]